MHSIKNILFFCLAGLILLTQISCNKLDNEPEPSPSKSMQDLNVPAGFNYETRSTQQLEIRMPASVDYTDLRSRFNIYTQENLLESSMIGSGSFDQQGVFKGEVSFPATQENLYISTMAGIAKVELNNLKDGVIIDFGDNYIYTAPDTMEFKSLPSAVDKEILIKANSTRLQGQNLVGNGDFSQNDFGYEPYWDAVNSVDGKWYFSDDNNRGYMEWYNDNGNGMVRTHNSNNRFVGGVSQLLEASPGDVITFTADIKRDGNGTLYSWLYLIPRHSSGFPLRYFALTHFDISSSFETKSIVATMPAGTEYVQVLFWTNDYTKNGRIYLDNVVVSGPVTDTDGDGVDDELDDYPNDDTRAFNIYYPGSETYGTFAFEDNWPGKGDYDFNDLVVDYRFKEVINANNELVDMDATFIFKAAGATLVNGFGFEMGLAPNLIEEVSGSSLVGGYINTLSNGSEAGQAKGTIIVTDNVFTQLPNPGGGIGTNTTPGASYVEPDTMLISISTISPVALSQAGRPPYNPFMIIDQNRGREMHLSGYPPTSLANTAYYGTMDDDTRPAEDKYYQTSNNLPWAIDIPAPFSYPIEKKEIIQAYLHFAEWAESGGILYGDWYEDKSGYRDENNIFSAPE